MKYCFLLIITSLICSTLLAQNKAIPILEREITINVSNQPIQVVLKTISQQANFTFSYNSAIFSAEKKININIQQKPVRLVLNQLFKGEIKYKAKGKYIILQKNENFQKQQNNNKQKQIIEGYVYDLNTGKKLAAASIYDKNLGISTLTNQYGFFSITLPNEKSNLQISKYGYNDTVLIPLAIDKDIEISLNTSSIQLDTTKKTLQKKITNWLISKNIIKHTQNLKDTLFKNIQFSLIPFISTNYLLTGNTSNNLSVNLIAGYTQEVKVAEFAGALNIVRNNAGVCQLAGVANIVGGKSTGLQAAGSLNIAKEVQGVQISGAINHANKVTGMQISGAINNATEIKGMQISGLINRASYFNGVQLSVLNIADSCKGIPIGLFSYVKNGYHKFELSADELFYTNIAFRTGVKHFYNIFNAGVQPQQLDQPIWSFGLGLGANFGDINKLGTEINLTSQQLASGNSIVSENKLYKFYLGIEKKLYRKTSIALGLTYNLLVLDTKTTDYQNYFSNIAPSYLLSNDIIDNGLSVQTWIGGKIAFRFL